MYKIFIEKIALKRLEKIPASDKTKIILSIEALGKNPRPIGSKKLSGRAGWRIRIGNYRVIYEINDSVCLILVIDVDHRKNIYR